MEGTEGAGVNTRVLYAPAAGADRKAPENLPMVGHAEGEMGGGSSTGSNLLPSSRLRAYAIDTFWSPEYTGKRGGTVIEIPYQVQFDAKFQSIVDATGEPAPVHHWEAVPSPPPSYYIQTPDNGEPEKLLSGLQMFGAETQWEFGGQKPRDTSRVLLLEYPLRVPDYGSLQFWIKTKDLNAQHFERAGMRAYFS
jgi:hypothetical protein